MSTATQTAQAKSLERSFTQSASLIEPQKITDVLRNKSFKGSHPDIVAIGNTIVQRLLDESYDARLLATATAVAEAVEGCLQRTYMEAGNQHDCDETILEVETTKTGKVIATSRISYDEAMERDNTMGSDVKPANGLQSYRFALTNAVTAANRSAVFENLCLELVLDDRLMISVNEEEMYSNAQLKKAMEF